ncbi:MAG: GNAT family N-acetyltransferase [Duncaniella sp.]|nr:GNAT family N-acetyltransferase [Duncaniella sp.]
MITIRDARPDDAEFIAKCICWAVGDEIVDSLAAVTPGHTRDDVRRMFTALAEGTGAQYSYLNTIIAADSETDRPVGALIAYDGARLHRLRRAFYPAAEKFLDWHVTDLPDECQPDEYYIDTLGVHPDFRGRGIAKALLESTLWHAAEIGKPAALLVDKTNHRARGLYNRLGFLPYGEHPFAGVMMDHLRHPLPT